jgi:hypothetical protein
MRSRVETIALRLTGGERLFDRSGVAGPAQETGAPVAHLTDLDRMRDLEGRDQYLLWRFQGGD